MSVREPTGRPCIKGNIPGLWADGTRFDFINFYKNEPEQNYDKENGDCLKYRTNENDGPGFYEVKFL